MRVLCAWPFIFFEFRVAGHIPSSEFIPLKGVLKRVPRMGIIIRSACRTIAEQTLPRSLPLVAYLNLEYILRFRDSGIIPG
jgi:hypothetical protein